MSREYHIDSITETMHNTNELRTINISHVSAIEVFLLKGKINMCVLICE